MSEPAHHAAPSLGSPGGPEGGRVVMDAAAWDACYVATGGEGIAAPNRFVVEHLSAVPAHRAGRPGQLYDSLQSELMTLPPATRGYPAHGAGSACGKNLSTDTWSTIGDQLETNYALQIDDRQAFVDAVTEGQPSAPAYFAFDAVRNRQARPLLDEHEAPPAMTLGDVRAAVDAGAVVVDTRDAAEFARAHLVGSLNVGLDGRFAEYAGSLVGPDDRIVLVTEPGLELQATVRLGRIGFDDVVGHLDRPLAAFADHPDRVAGASRLTAAGFDVRRAERGDTAQAASARRLRRACCAPGASRTCPT